MKSYRYRQGLLCLLSLIVCITWNQSVVLCAEESAGKLGGDKSAFPEFPQVSLAKLKPVEGEADPTKYWSQRVEALIETASKAEKPFDKSRSMLAAANILLGRILEPFSSMAVLNMPHEQTSEDISSLHSNLDRAEKLIAESRELLKSKGEHSETGGEAPAEAPAGAENSKADGARLLQAAETLQSFLNGQRAFLLEETEPGARRRAASALAPLLEEADKKTASAARLWQALLRGLEADPTAALHILGTPITSPPPETWPYGLFSKVIYCRYQGIQGSWSSALMMLLHIEEQLEEWVPDAAYRGDARRFFAYTRLGVLKRWYDSLPPERETERAWCASQAQEIVKVYFSVDLSLLRLDPAVPMIFPDDAYKAGEAKALSP